MRLLQSLPWQVWEPGPEIVPTILNTAETLEDSPLGGCTHLRCFGSCLGHLSYFTTACAVRWRWTPSSQQQHCSQCSSLPDVLPTQIPQPRLLLLGLQGSLTRSGSSSMIFPFLTFVCFLDDQTSLNVCSYNYFFQVWGLSFSVKYLVGQKILS